MSTYKQGALSTAVAELTGARRAQSSPALLQPRTQPELVAEPSLVEASPSPSPVESPTTELLPEPRPAVVARDSRPPAVIEVERPSPPAELVQLADVASARSPDPSIRVSVKICSRALLPVVLMALLLHHFQPSSTSPSRPSNLVRRRLVRSRPCHHPPGWMHPTSLLHRYQHPHQLLRLFLTTTGCGGR